MTAFLNRARRAIDDIERSGRMHPHSGLYVMAQFRQHIEESGSSAALSTIMHYANWTLHPQLERRPIPSLLDDVSNALRGDRSTIGNEIVDVLRLRELRQEILSLLSGHRGEVLFHSLTGWKRFMSSVLPEIVDKRWVRTQSAQVPTSGRYATWLELSVPDLSTIHPDHVQAAGLEERAVVWSVEVGPIGYFVQGPLTLAESPSDFLLP